MTALALASIALLLTVDVAEAQLGGARRRTRRRTAVVVSSATHAADQQAAAEKAAADKAAADKAAADKAAADKAAADKAAAEEKKAVSGTPPAPGGGPGALPLGAVVTKLPGGCATVAVGGVAYYHCGADYYRAVFQENVLVYVTTAAPQ